MKSHDFWLFLSDLLHLVWYSQDPSMLLQMTIFHLFLWLGDVDPSSQGPCVVTMMNKFTGTTEVLWRKRMAWPLSAWERAATLAWTGFYCFSGHITLRMILIYYAQVRFRWLPVGENKGEDVASYIKEEGYLQMQRAKCLNWLHSSLWSLAQILGSYFKDMQ